MIKSISQWATEFDINSKTWLLLGKGPSFEKLSTVPISDFHVCSLNHVVRELPVTLAHMIDIDVVPECADAIEHNAKFLLLPWHPHVNCTASPRTLAEFASEIPVLRRMESQGRLLCYNLYSGRRFDQFPDSSLIMARYFSAEAALNILAENGATSVRSLGIDGGNRYGKSFKHLESTTLLANRRDSFDQQFETISETIRRTGILYGPLYVDCPARVFIGCPETHLLPARVLGYSLKKHSSITLEITFVDADRLVDIPLPRKLTLSGRSYAPFKVPELCNFSGRAIYLDPNALVLSDIAELWTQSVETSHLLYSKFHDATGHEYRFSSMMLDCGSLRWCLSDLVRAAKEKRVSLDELPIDMTLVGLHEKSKRIPEVWNSVESFVDGQTRLIRYANHPVAPWLSAKNPLQSIWIKYLKGALEEGFVDDALIYDQISKGNAAPKLPRWIGLSDPPDYERLIAEWVPPHARVGDDNDFVTKKLSISRLGRALKNVFYT